MATAFEEATAVTALGDGAWGAVSDPGWAAPIGPNGGYLAAIVLRAMQAELADEHRPARSITLHYLRPPQPGPVTVHVTVERSGRRLSTLTARLRQEDRDCVLALGAFSGPLGEGLEEFSAAMPVLPAPAEVEPWGPFDQAPPIAHRWVMRPAIGALPFSGGREALAGGWMSLLEPQRLDAPALALYTDLWLPAVFSRQTRPAAVPTVDLTIHFRDPAAALAVAPDAPIAGVFRSDYAADGLVEEDGELWSPDGVLLAHSRQLALYVPLEGRA